MISTLKQEEKTAQSKKKRRRFSFKTVRWNVNLEPNECLKKLKKGSLGVSQQIFDQLQYQMYITNILPVKKGINVLTKENYEYHFPVAKSTDIGDMENDLYIKVIKKLTAEEACKLLIFRYYNLEFASPSKEFVKLFHESHTIQNTNDLLLKTILNIIIIILIIDYKLILKMFFNIYNIFLII